MKVEIHTETDVHGLRAKRGKYAAVVVCQTKRGPAVKGIVREEQDTTFHRAALLAVLAGLEMLMPGCEVTVHTPDQLLVTMIKEGNVEKWKREEWRRPQDKELKNKELWQQLEEALGKHAVSFVYTKYGAYSEELKKRMKNDKNITDV